MKKNIFRKSLVIGIIILSVGASVVSAFNVNLAYESKPMNRGNWLYVGGSEPGNYSKIKDAIDNATSGDTVFVYDDSSPYYEYIYISKSIDLFGENKDTTVIDGGGINYHNVVTISDNEVEINGFTIRNSGSGSSYAGIAISSSNNIINGNIISNNYGSGILCSFSSVGNTISGNIIETNYFYGIDLHQSNGNTVSENIINFNSYDGVYLYQSSDNIITSNTIDENLLGINSVTSSKDNTVSHNIICNNLHEGIGLSGSNSNIINANNISSNGRDGISMASSSSNIISENSICYNGWDNGGGITGGNNNNIYHNNFIENVDWNAYDQGINTWDDGYPSGGNYWKDYIGSDGDGDGIGDTPYPIPGGDNQDFYPFMEPDGWLNKNKPPNIPNIDGPNSGKTGIEYDYIFNSIDPNGDNVKYIINWGDTTSDNTSFNPSGTDVTVSHTWATKGIYTITAKAVDESGLTSPEATKIVTILKNKALFTTRSILLWLLQRSPNILPIIKHILA